MRAAIQAVYTNPKYAKALEWGKLISTTGGTQILIQSIGLISGVLIIRLLSVQEYAMYTLANSLLATMTLLSDSGISAGVISQGGKVWKDKNRLGLVLISGLALRKRFSIFSLILCLPILFYLLVRHNASWSMAVAVSVSIIPAFINTLSGTLYEIVPKLKQEIIPLQKIQIANNVGKAILVCLFLITIPMSFTVVLTIGIVQFISNGFLKNLAKTHANLDQIPDIGIQKEILLFVKRIMPNTIYYCLSGQVIIFIASLFGNTTSIAQIGALGRIAVITSMFQLMLTTLVLPRFARLSGNRKELFNFYSYITILLLFIGFILSIMVLLFSSPILSVLGDNYKNLETELLLTIVGSSLSMISSFIYSICTVRSWLISPVMSISVNVSVVSIGIAMLNTSALSGILWLNIFVASSQVVLNVSYGFWKILKKAHADG